MTELSFDVEGLPAPQGSKNAFKHKDTGKVVMIESAGDRLKAWRQIVTLKARSAAGLRAWKQPRAVVVHMTFYLPRPKRHFGTGRNAGILKPSAPIAHVTKPDGDKLTRAIFDAITDAHVIPDDSAIVGFTTWKMYADMRPTGAQITLLDWDALDTDDAPG